MKFFLVFFACLCIVMAEEPVVPEQSSYAPPAQMKSKEESVVSEQPSDSPPIRLVKPEGELEHSGIRRTFWYSNDLHYLPGKSYEHNTEVLNKKQVKSIAEEGGKPLEIPEYREIELPATQLVDENTEVVLPEGCCGGASNSEGATPQVQYVQVIPTSAYYRDVVAPLIAAKRQ